MDWLENVFATVAMQGALIATLGFLARSFVRQWLDKDLGTRRA